MSVKYKVKQISNASSKLDGWYFARAVIIETLTTSDVCDLIEENCTAKASDVRAVVTEMINVLQRALANGQQVWLEGIGRFYLSLHATAVENVKDCTAATIKGIRIGFRPEVERNTNGTYSAKLAPKITYEPYNEYRPGVNDKDLDDK